MRQRQIGHRSHLDQSRGCALELLRLVAFGGVIERIRLGSRGRDQLHAIVVERIDQNDEALGGIALAIVAGVKSIGTPLSDTFTSVAAGFN